MDAIDYNVLYDEKISLNDRLKKAVDLFVLPDGDVTKIRTAILQWFAKILTINGKDEEIEIICDQLFHCLKFSNNCAQFHNEISDILITMFRNVNYTASNVLELLLKILKNDIFRKHFTHNFSSLLMVTDSLLFNLKKKELQSKSDGTLVNIVVNVFHCVIYVIENTPVKAKFRLYFVTEMLISLLKLTTFCVPEANDICKVFRKCLKEVLFYDAEQKKLFKISLKNSNYFLDVTDDDLEKNVMGALKLILVNELLSSISLQKLFYPAFFGALAESGSNGNELFLVFLIVCDFIGNPVDRNKWDSSELILHDRLNADRNADVLSIFLTDVFDRYNVPLSANAEGTVLSEWITKTARCVVHAIETTLTESLCILLNDIINFHPTITESIFGEIMKYVYCRRKDDEKIYSAFCRLSLSIATVYCKMNRFQKFVATLLSTLKDLSSPMNKNGNPVLIVVDIFPDSIIQVFELQITNVTNSSQYFALFKTLLFHFEADCICLYESNVINKEPLLDLQFSLFSLLLTTFLKRTRIFDHIVPIAAKQKFSLMLEEMSCLLNRLGQEIIFRTHDPKKLCQFLEICCVWGDVKLMKIQYEVERDDSNEPPPSKKICLMPKSPTNLTYLHPYLSEDTWDLIAQRVANFGDEGCTDQFAHLILQKLESLSILSVRDRSIDIGAVSANCVQYLLHKSSTKFLMNNLMKIEKYLSQKDVLNLSKLLLDYYQTHADSEISEFLQSFEKSSRALILAFICCVFHVIGKRYSKVGLKTMRRVMNKLDCLEVVKHEMELDDNSKQYIIEFCESISEMVTDSFNSPQKIIKETVHLSKEINILLKMPLRYLHYENRLLLTLLGFILLGSSTCAEDKSLEKIQKFLQIVSRHITLPSKLDLAIIMNWLRISENRGMTDKNKLYSFLFIACDANFGLQFFTDLSNKATNENLNADEISDTINLCTLYLLHTSKPYAKKKNFNENKISGDVNECHRYVEELLSKLLNSEEVIKMHYMSYVLLMTHALRQQNTSLIKTLSPFLLEIMDHLIELSPKNIEIGQFGRTLIIHKNLLPQNINIFPKVWNILKVCTTVCYSNLSTSLERNPQYSGVRLITDELSLFSDLNAISDENDSVKIKELCKCLLSVYADDQNSIYGFMESCSHNALKWMCNIRLTNVSNERIPHIIELFLDIFVVLFQHDKVRVHDKFVDACFSLLKFSLTYPQILNTSIETLFVMHVTRRTMVLDRIPTFLIVYKLIYEKICHLDSPETAPAHKLVKLTDVVTKNSSDFKHVCVGQLFDLMNVFKFGVVLPSIQVHAKNILYYWIQLCHLNNFQDSINSSLPDHLELCFRKLLFDYNKYFKYKGKV